MEPARANSADATVPRKSRRPFVTNGAVKNDVVIFMTSPLAILVVLLRVISRQRMARSTLGIRISDIKARRLARAANWRFPRDRLRLLGRVESRPFEVSVAPEDAAQPPPFRVVGTAVFPTLGDTLGLGKGATLVKEKEGRGAATQATSAPQKPSAKEKAEPVGA